jgi:hypothetical protein
MISVRVLDSNSEEHVSMSAIDVVMNIIGGTFLFLFMCASLMHMYSIVRYNKDGNETFDKSKIKYKDGDNT